MDNELDLSNVAVDVCCELGRKGLTLKEARALKVQDVIELDKLAGEPFEVRVNGRPFALGEVVVVNEMVAVRITRLVAPLEEAG